MAGALFSHTHSILITQHVRIKNSIFIKEGLCSSIQHKLEIIPLMSPASTLLKKVYFSSMNPVSSSMVLYFFINPGSTCTVSIFNQHALKSPNSQTGGT